MNMEFNEKLQKLRSQNALTQEQLAEKVFVSRVAVAKWESGRGYPNLESLKRLANVFEVSIDQLLSSDELIDLAEVETNHKLRVCRSLLLGILDFISILLFVIPLFANREGGKIETVNLLQFRNQHSYIKNTFIALIASSSLFGVIELLFQSVQDAWKRKLELTVSGIFSCVGVMILIVTKQPYPSVFLFTLFVIKVVVALNTQR